MLSLSRVADRNSSSRSEKLAASRRAVRYVASFTIAFLVIFSLLPLRPRATIHGTSGHLFLHVAGFAVAAFASLLLTLTRVQQLVTVMGLVSLALAIETGQSVIFHQRMEWNDVLLDSFGTLLAFMLLCAGQTLTRKPA